jgi:hypothetical protein
MIDKPKKRHEITIKKGMSAKEVKLDLADYRAFISFSLIGITSFLAFIGNEAWREFALMTGMAIAWWFKRSDKV